MINANWIALTVTRLNARNTLPRPFLKWVGGKRQLLPELLRAVKKAEPFERYYEPFVGGGALFFELAAQNRLGTKKACLSDTNPRLIETYQVVQSDVEALIEILREHKIQHEALGKEHYYAVRTEVPNTSVARAARIIYLNRTCFNGLYRENSKGLFNTPMGAYKKPRICDTDKLRAASDALQGAQLRVCEFAAAVKDAVSGDFVYFDPPYDPVSKTASFTSYDQKGFGEEAQVRLADTFAELESRGVKALLSNSATPLIKSLYKDFTIQTVLAARKVNSRADRRGPVSEVLVRNY